MTKALSLSKEKIRIVLFEGIHTKAVEAFRAQGYSNVELLTGSLSGSELADKIKDAHMIGIRSRTQIKGDVIHEAKKLMAVGCFCIGTNQVDLKETALKGIPVFNAPHSNTRSVAELVIGQTIMLMRGIFAKSTLAHQGSWSKSAKNSHEVRGKTMGIVGYGHIGAQVSILAEAMGLHVIYFDVQTKLPLGNAKPVSTLQALLEQSDVTTLHVPEAPSTKNLMSREMIARMKPGSYLINASRGSVVDIEALAEALKNKALFGAAIDVFPKEPKTNDEPFESALLGLDNVILTPHIGGSTLEAQENIGVEVARKLAAFSDTGVTEGTVNFPIVNLPLMPDAHRILHIHHNIPGILRQINRALGLHDINVLGQYLATQNEIGYVVLDVDRKSSTQLTPLLAAIEGTIRTRILY